MNETLKIAMKIAAEARRMGLEARLISSRISESEYVYVQDPDVDSRVLKIRVSRHEARPNGHANVNYEIECGRGRQARMDTHGNSDDCILWIAQKFGRDTEAIVAKIERRRDAARRAALTRAQKDGERTNQMIAAVLAHAPNGPLTKIRAGKIIDYLYPAIPRAQRQTIAFDAAAKRKNELAYAAIAAAIATGDYFADRSKSGKTWRIEGNGFCEEFARPDGVAFSREAVADLFLQQSSFKA